MSAATPTDLTAQQDATDRAGETVEVVFGCAPVAVATSDAEDYVPPVDLPNAAVDAVAHHANYWPLTHGAIGKSFYRFAQELKDEVIARLPPHCFTKPTPAVLSIDFKQATELLAMFGGEPGEVTLLTGEGHSGRGLYAHYSEYPEEGAEFLGVADDEAMPGKQATDQGGWQPIATAPKNTPIRLYAEGGGFYDEDFNPSGSVEGQWTDGAWCGAFWDPVHDTWFRRDDIVPTHWQPLPAAPTLLGVADGDAVGGKSGGAA